MARVVLDQVSKVFPGPKGELLAAVNAVSLTVEDKELVVLVGPSGAGKSTLLRLIAGLEVATAGTIAIDGCVVNQVPPQDRDVAMVFQHHALYPHLTVYGNLALGLHLRRVPKAEADRRVRTTAEWLGLTPLLERMPSALSGGERQRVALGRALVRQPKVFLLDEPLSHLDAPLRAQLRADLKRLQARLGATVVYVTHDQAEALALGERLVVLRDGQIQQAADPLTLYRRPANRFVAGFIGSPPMNFLRGRLEPRGETLEVRLCAAAGSPSPFALAIAATRAAVLEGAAGRDVIVGIRPEDVRLQPHPATNAATPSVLTGTVDLVEAAGAEAHVHVRVLGQAIVARVPSDSPARPGQVVAVEFAAAHARLFDPASASGVALG
ncbi:MAG: ABC transporter ATP-binding protein [Verrucomicrobia bacterium]|nr:ABC transporter ATP-binding protein [Verrucomicrobiota bacterium]